MFVIVSSPTLTKAFYGERCFAPLKKVDWTFIKVANSWAAAHNAWAPVCGMAIALWGVPVPAPYHLGVGRALMCAIFSKPYYDTAFFVDSRGVESCKPSPIIGRSIVVIA